jgi:hypothetical protein
MVYPDIPSISSVLAVILARHKIFNAFVCQNAPEDL